MHSFILMWTSISPTLYTLEHMWGDSVETSWATLPIKDQGCISQKHRKLKVDRFQWVYNVLKLTMLYLGNTAQSI